MTPIGAPPDALSCADTGAGAGADTGTHAAHVSHALA